MIDGTDPLEERRQGVFGWARRWCGRQYSTHQRFILAIVFPRFGVRMSRNRRRKGTKHALDAIQHEREVEHLGKLVARGVIEVVVSMVLCTFNLVMRKLGAEPLRRTHSMHETVEPNAFTSLAVGMASPVPPPGPSNQTDGAASPPQHTLPPPAGLTTAELVHAGVVFYYCCMFCVFPWFLQVEAQGFPESAPIEVPLSSASPALGRRMSIGSTGTTPDPLAHSNPIGAVSSATSLNPRSQSTSTLRRAVSRVARTASNTAHHISSRIVAAIHAMAVYAWRWVLEFSNDWMLERWVWCCRAAPSFPAVNPPLLFVRVDTKWCSSSEKWRRRPRTRSGRKQR
jgi:hypothetical protein